MRAMGPSGPIRNAALPLSNRFLIPASIHNLERRYTPKGYANSTRNLQNYARKTVATKGGTMSRPLLKRINHGMASTS